MHGAFTIKSINYSRIMFIFPHIGPLFQETFNKPIDHDKGSNKKQDLVKMIDHKADPRNPFSEVLEQD